MSFVHLHAHTEYSILDANNRIKDYVARCKELGMTAAAITDHGVMYGVIDFYHACESAGIKPILGCEVYVAPKSRLDKDSSERYNHLVLLAETLEGYNNISHICSEGFMDGFYYKPRVDDEILEKYHKGVIALSACLAGRIPKFIVGGKYEEAKAAALKYRQIFGENNFFLELQDHGIPDQKAVITGLLRIHNETGIPLVATNDCHYTTAEDADAHDILLCIQQEKMFDDPDRMRDNERQYYVKSEEEMSALFPYAREAIDNTGIIADRCNVEIKFHETKMPSFPVPDGYTQWSYLNKLSYDGFENRYAAEDESTKAQIKSALEYQLSVIKDMGYVEYFLVVWDYCNWARENGVSVGPGRGSAAGSYVTYCIGITDIDPLKYDLQFERFLNPERVSMPDIDVDFSMRNRPKVIEHVKEVYGSDCVTQIITFGRMTAKAVIKTVGKYLGYPYAYCSQIANMIPKTVNMTIKLAMEQNHELQELYDSDKEAKRIIDSSLRLEGLPKSTGTHAAGVVVANKPVMDYIPIARSTDGSGFVSQFTMTAVEELGLLKMDFLGLRTLTVEDDAIEDIKTNRGADIDLDKIDYADAEVFKYISTGNTDGVFQLESKGMQDFMRKLCPGSVEDLTAGISLYRPGPMDYIPAYIEGKNNAANIRYDCPQLEPILKATYGCIVYQEQVTSIVKNLAGYSMGQADNIRRAMSKKKQYVIDAERKSFVFGDDARNIPGCIKNVGITEDVANRIYDHMVDFAKYAFNKSHAACYAVVCYQTAWLIKYYPVEYWAAIMTSVIDKTDALVPYIMAAKNSGIKIDPPDINHSNAKFHAEGDNIVYALCGIKGVSVDIGEQIVAGREKDGLFRDYTDALERLTKYGLDKTGIKNLINAGAFDCFGGLRRQYIMTYENYLGQVKNSAKTNVEGQMSLFDMIPAGQGQALKITLPDIGEYSKDQLLENEKDAAGIYISGHPLDNKSAYIKKFSTIKSSDFIGQADDDGETAYDNISEGQKIVICGIFTRVAKKFTKKNDAMAFVTIEDLYGTVDGVVFPKVYENCRSLAEDQKAVVYGHVAIDDERGASIIVDNVVPFNDIPQKLWIKYESKSLYEADAENIKNRTSAGKDSIVVYLKAEKQMTKYESCIDVTDSVIEEYKKIYGENNIAISL